MNAIFAKPISRALRPSNRTLPFLRHMLTTIARTEFVHALELLDRLPFARLISQHAVRSLPSGLLLFAIARLVSQVMHHMHQNLAHPSGPCCSRVHTIHGSRAAALSDKRDVDRVETITERRSCRAGRSRHHCVCRYDLRSASCQPSLGAVYVGGLTGDTKREAFGANVYHLGFFSGQSYSASLYSLHDLIHEELEAFARHFTLHRTITWLWCCPTSCS